MTKTRSVVLISEGCRAKRRKALHRTKRWEQRTQQPHQLCSEGPDVFTMQMVPSSLILLLCFTVLTPFLLMNLHSLQNKNHLENIKLCLKILFPIFKQWCSHTPNTLKVEINTIQRPQITTASGFPCRNEKRRMRGSTTALPFGAVVQSSTFSERDLMLILPPCSKKGAMNAC